MSPNEISDRDPSAGTITGITDDEARLILQDADARNYVKQATDGVASLVRSTLGPQSLDTLIETEDPQGEPEIVLSNDGATILKAIERGDGFGHPVAALFVDAVDSMQRGIEDGTTTAILLSSFLVQNGFELIEEGVHSSTVALGYNVAAGRAGQVFDELAQPVAADRNDLTAVARTSMTVDLPEEVLSRYSKLAAKAVRRLEDHGRKEWLDADEVKVVGSEAATQDRFYPGIVVRQWPRGLKAMEQEYGRQEEFDWTLELDGPIEDVGVTLLDRDVDFEETATPLGENTYDGAAGVAVETVEELDAYRTGLTKAIADECERLGHLGIEVIIAQPELDDNIRQALRTAGFEVVDDVQTPQSDIHRIARLTNGVIVSRLEELTEEHVGRIDRMDQRRIGEEKWTVFERESGPGSTIVLRTGTATGAAVRERMVEDAINVAAIAVMDDQLLPGAGAAALAAAHDLREFATTLHGQHQLAVDGFADALEQLVSVLVRNAGHDHVTVLSTARAAHSRTDEPAPIGVDLDSGEPIDAWKVRVIEPRRVFSQTVETAQVTAEQLLTADSIFFAGEDPASHVPLTDLD